MAAVSAVMGRGQKVGFRKLAVSTVALGAVIGVAVPASALSGGTAAPDGSYGYAARIVVNGTTAGCSGAVVAQGWVLTAKACFGATVVDGPPPQPTTVSVGPKVADVPDLVVDRLVPYPDRDVVLAHVLSSHPSTPVPAQTPVPIGVTAPATGDTLRLAGFGRTATDWVPARLNTASYTVQGVAATSASIAATGGANDPCKGDAGGPVLRDVGDHVELVGIASTSWQHGCLDSTETRTGATVTRVDDLGPWIAQQTVPLSANPNRFILADLDGDHRAELMVIYPNGDVHAWHNDGGGSATTWNPADVVVATGMTVDRTYFADLDGDGKADLISLGADGDAHAWHNTKGFAASPFDTTVPAGVKVATGFPDGRRLKWADLDGDHKSDVLSVDATGDVRAWHNGAGFAEMPWNGFIPKFATGMTVDGTFFPDLDGDGKADVVQMRADNNGYSWRNARGFVQDTWDPTLVRVVEGFTNPLTLRFADLNGDGKPDAVAIDPNNQIRTWPNTKGWAEMPWGAPVVIPTPYVP